MKNRFYLYFYYKNINIYIKESNFSNSQMIIKLIIIRFLTELF